MTTSVGVHEAKTHLSRLLERVAAGEEVEITNRGPSGRPAGRSRPAQSELRVRPRQNLDRGRLRRPPRGPAARLRGRGVKVLLDTHVLVWAAATPERLGGAAAVLGGADQRLLSAVCVWELAIKQGLGKLSLGTDVRTWTRRVTRELVLDR